MPKIADTYIAVDPWKIIEKGWDSERNRTSESLFSLGNEYMGVRAYFEEGLSTNSINEKTLKNLTLKGSYFNGIYEIEKLQSTTYKGIVNKTHFMVNSVDWLYTRIYVDGELIQIDLKQAKERVSHFERVLDMQKGTLVRSFDFLLSSGKTIQLSFKRFLDMQDASRAFQSISILSKDTSIDVVVETGCDFSIIHESREKNYWNVLHTESNDSYAGILAETLSTKQKVFSGFTCSVSKYDSLENISQDALVLKRYSVKLNGKTSFTLEKNIYNLVDKSNEFTTSAFWERGKNVVHTQKSTFSDAEKQQELFWKDVWEKGDICISGDDLNQQGIRFCIFQMHQTYHGLDASNNIGAKGLTGESYNGHAFWDTETYCLPFYLYANPKAAKNLLDFRYKTLAQAKERAKMLDCLGACYPVATLNGEEACDLWQHASLQFQPSTGVAYGIAHYYAVSGDTDFLYSHGAEMLIEICRFLVSRGQWNQDKSGFGFYAVMGPDEFHMMVNNNVYTNIMAKKTFEYTISVLEKMKTKEKSYENLVIQTELKDSEIALFTSCAEKMIILYDEETLLYEQHEGFFSLPHKDISSIPLTDFPLYHHWSYDRIYRYDMIKQPDVLMFMFLHRSEFPKSVLSKNYDYYEPRTIHESSLSPSVHSILALDIGRVDEAIRFFRFATRLDLDNYNRNTNEGLHTTSIAAAWLNIVFGFGGVYSEPGIDTVLKISPTLPDQWEAYNFRLLYKNVPLLVDVTKKEVKISALDNSADKRFSLKVYDTVYVLHKEPIIVPLKNGHSRV